jgi:choice-of-anchor B domain-containing protein
MKKHLFFLALLWLPVVLAAQQQATLLGAWSDPALVGSAAYNNTYNEIWGVAVNGHEYAIIGSTAGTHFIDVTEPTQPFEAHFVAGAAQGPTIIHRDYHDYQGFLYAVCDEGPSTLQIIDLRQLPDTVLVVYDYATQISRAHNIFIDSAQAKLYTFSTSGGPAGYSAMRIYDLADNPLNPQYINKYNNFGGLIASHVHDGYVRDGIAFLNCGNSGLAIVDFSNPAQPVPISILTDYPFRGYNHSGWLSDDAQYYYMADENHGARLKAIDLEDPCELRVTGTFNADVPNPTSIPHNQIVACDYLYVSYYYEGLVVFDISDPANPQKALYYDTSSEPNGPSYKGVWGVYPFLPSGLILVSDMQEGLFIFEGVGDNCAATQELQPIDLSCLNPTSLHELPEGTYARVFPQPAHEELNISISSPEGQWMVNADLLDINGRVVRRLGSENLLAGENLLQFPLGQGLAAGIYLLRLQGDGWNIVERVVIR